MYLGTPSIKLFTNGIVWLSHEYSILHIHEVATWRHWLKDLWAESLDISIVKEWKILLVSDPLLWHRRVLRLIHALLHLEQVSSQNGLNDTFYRSSRQLSRKVSILWTHSSRARTEICSIPPSFRHYSTTLFAVDLSKSYPFWLILLLCILHCAKSKSIKFCPCSTYQATRYTCARAMSFLTFLTIMYYVFL